jgi:hypothetical protein
METARCVAAADGCIPLAGSHQTVAALTGPNPASWVNNFTWEHS